MIIMKCRISDCDVTDDCFETEFISRTRVQVGNVSVDLPLAPDDYLLPSPHISNATTQYMDLIGDTKPGKSPLIDEREKN